MYHKQYCINVDMEFCFKNYSRNYDTEMTMFYFVSALCYVKPNGKNMYLNKSCVPRNFMVLSLSFICYARHSEHLPPTPSHHHTHTHTVPMITGLRQTFYLLSLPMWNWVFLWRNINLKELFHTIIIPNKQKYLPLRPYESIVSALPFIVRIYWAVSSTVPFIISYFSLSVAFSSLPSVAILVEFPSFFTWLMTTRWLESKVGSEVFRLQFTAIDLPDSLLKTYGSKVRPFP